MSEPRPTLAHRMEYALFQGAVGLCTLAGERAAARLGGWLGRLGWWPLGIRRGLVLEQLRRSFPGRDEAWIEATAASAYAHLGREAFALLQLSRMSAAEVAARTTVEGLDALSAALARGRGVVLVTGHLGNWELGGAMLAARGIPLDVVAQRQSNPLFDRMIVEVRERLGMRVIERGRAPKAGLRALREGRVVGFVADQDARGAGIFVPFFGRDASTHRGPALLALRTGAPLFLGTVLRAPEGGWRGRVEKVEIAREGATEEAVRLLTAAFTERLEMAIREAPAQYFWFHRRWKSRPPAGTSAAGPGINQGSEEMPLHDPQRF